MSASFFSSKTRKFEKNAGKKRILVGNALYTFFGHHVIDEGKGYVFMIKF